MRAILTYHSLDSSGSVISIRPQIFEDHVASLLASGITILPLNKVKDADNAVALTFDDGFHNFVQYAIPVLTKYNVPATVFVVSGYCGHWNDWTSIPLGTVPRLQLMSWAQLRALPPDLVSIGSHTITHAPLGRVNEKRIESEALVSKNEIEQRLGRTVDTLAYPYGSVNSPAQTITARHYKLACGTSLRYLGQKDDPMNLPRIDAYYLRRTTNANLTTWRKSTYFKTRDALRCLKVITLQKT